MMNVRDMIDLLGRYPDDMRVVVNGYEQGYDDLSPEQVDVVEIVLNTGTHAWEGKHCDLDDLPAKARAATKTVDALVFNRISN